ncbi:MAG TPA: ABC transporter permease subunit [Solirubrobacteraceae bacterium]|jgi:ABC-type phosphate transport system permease subunit|nr:ABC transporter permease subunit [Solirubrobacteraceae bacterium]
MRARLSAIWQPGAGGHDRRVELAHRAVVLALLALIGAIVITVFIKAWPSFQHNGLGWFGGGGDPDQQLNAMINGPKEPAHYVYHFTAWPLIWGTILTSGFAVLLGMAVSIMAAVFIVEFAPGPLRTFTDPVIRLLAGVPSVVYGLFGLLAIAPWIEHNLISNERKHSVQYVVQLTGANLLVATLILTLMIVPIMVAIVVAALESVPLSWSEGSAALGVNRWRTMRRVSLRTVRPAIIAAAVLATARALGEAIMLSMIGGSRGFAPNLLDGFTALFEPVRPLAATIIDYVDSLSVVPVGQTLYAMAAVLVVSCGLLSLAGWAARQPMKRYGLGA